MTSPAHVSNYFLGAHVSIQGGVFKAVENACAIGAKSFALFVGNQRTWRQKSLEEEEITKFKNLCKQNHFTNPHMILPHGSYLVNLGCPDSQKLKQSRHLFIHEVKKCHSLGIALYNFHPGSTLGQISEDESLSLVAESINLCQKEVEDVILVIENTAGQGNNIGYKFEHLKDIIKGVEDKSRVGVCIDTCHMFAAGYDIRTKSSFDQSWKAFEDIIGFEYLKAMHLNDSKGDLACRKDRHENLGRGKIGPNAFGYIMNDYRFCNIPLVLETPSKDGLETYSNEISQLYSCVGKEEQEFARIFQCEHKEQDDVDKLEILSNDRKRPRTSTHHQEINEEANGKQNLKIMSKKKRSI